MQKIFLDALKYTDVTGFIPFLPNGSEWIILVVIGLLLFGKRLPGIARSLGQSVVEFKRGIKGIKDEIESESESKKSVSSDEPKTIDVDSKRAKSTESETREEEKASA